MAENFGRNSFEVTAFRRVAPELGLYGGVNWSYNVHPDNAESIIVRTGMQVETSNRSNVVLPFGAVKFFAGPSAQGQFHEANVRHLTFGMYSDP